MTEEKTVFEEVEEVESPIITDVSILHQRSEDVKWILLGENSSIPTIDSATEEKVEKLLAACPGDELGLAAPQIGIMERFFVANLSSGRYLFINPKLIMKHKGTSKERFQKVASTEGCLSLPGIKRSVSRHRNVTIEADLTYKVKDNNLSRITSEQMNLRDRDSFVVQHEYDHLDGILIIDLPEVKVGYQKVAERMNKRRERKELKKQKKEMLGRFNTPRAKINSKKQAKLLKNQKSYNKQEKKRVMIQEQYEFDKKELKNNEEE